MLFNTESSAEALDAYLDRTETFDEIFMMLFSHCVNSVGLVPIERWRKLLQRTAKRGQFVGVDPKAYPRDFAVFARYQSDLVRKVRQRRPLPPSVTPRELDEFLRASQSSYPSVQWL
jgi:hypothetical protein